MGMPTGHTVSPCSKLTAPAARPPMSISHAPNIAAAEPALRVVASMARAGATANTGPNPKVITANEPAKLAGVIASSSARIKNAPPPANTSARPMPNNRPVCMRPASRIDTKLPMKYAPTMNAW